METARKSADLALPKRLTSIKVLIIADRFGWCFSSRALALQQHAPADIQIDVVHYGHTDINHLPFPAYDVVFCLPPGQIKRIAQIFHANSIRVPLLAGWNSDPNREGYSITELCPFADYIICNNWQAWRAASEHVPYFRGCHISNGLDLTFFRPTVPIEQRPNRVLWIAGKEKAESESDVKGYRSVASPTSKICAQLGIETDFRAVAAEEEMSPEEMRDWYNSGKVFLCTSLSEGTPNVVLEAMACGCAVVTTRVGNTMEIIRHGQNGMIVEANCKPPTPYVLREIQAALASAERIGPAARKSLKDYPPAQPRCDGSILSNGSWDWCDRARWYYAVFRRAASGMAELDNFSYLLRHWCEI